MVERWGEMASSKSCAVSPEAPALGKLSTFFPPPADSYRGVQKQNDTCFACFSAWTILRFAIRATEPHVPLKPNIRFSNILCLENRTMFRNYCNGTTRSHWPFNVCLAVVYCVCWNDSHNSVPDKYAINPIKYCRSSLLQVLWGLKLHQGFQRWKNGLCDAWLWWRMTHPHFEDWGN